MKSYDLLVIGGGSGGHAAAAMAVKLGLATALIENAGVLGGLCVLRGCMPSKTLIESANRLRDIREAGRFGIVVAGEATADAAAIRKRVETLVEDFRHSRVEGMKEAGYELIRGGAVFLSPHEVEVTLRDGGRERLEARAFVIATGSAPAVPEIEGLKETPYWTSDEVVRLPFIPKRLVVLGGGAIGMECAHLFEGLGSEVTVVIRSERTLKEFDPEVAKALEAESEARGIRFLRKTTIAKVAHADGVFTLRPEQGEPLRADAVLVATGRSPRTEGIEASGVEMKHGRILIDRHAASSVPHIFAAGDCASPFPVVHLAVIQGEVAAKNIARLLHGGGGEPLAVWHEESAMTALFTEPQVMKVGIDEETMRGQGYDPVSGRQDYFDYGKGIIVGARHGFAKVTIDRGTGLILGATAVGPQVAETGHLLQFAISRRLTIDEYLQLPHYHPTLAEAWQRAAEAATEAR
ncbi:MAG: NAD(P)/FAD-dependent oxidoreductase [Akkermansiaceae bacterium]|nr:NAD(P)/FAD-dependent oxidoreductase [Akkermansiaceae bacterium]